MRGFSLFFQAARRERLCRLKKEILRGVCRSINMATLRVFQKSDSPNNPDVHGRRTERPLKVRCTHETLKDSLTGTVYPGRNINGNYEAISLGNFSSTHALRLTPSGSSSRLPRTPAETLRDSGQRQKFRDRKDAVDIRKRCPAESRSRRSNRGGTGAFEPSGLGRSLC